MVTCACWRAKALRAWRRAGACCRRASRSRCGASGGSCARLPSATLKRGVVLPHSAARRSLAVASVLRARFVSSFTLASKTVARVASTGDALPAVTRRAVTAVARAASACALSASCCASCAASTSTKAPATSARVSACCCARAASARCWPDSAAALRAARLPPSSISWFSCMVVLRLARRVSSTSVCSSGLGRARACCRAPPCAASSWRAADRVGLASCASAMAAGRLKGPAGSCTACALAHRAASSNNENRCIEYSSKVEIRRDAQPCTGLDGAVRAAFTREVPPRQASGNQSGRLGASGICEA